MELTEFSPEALRDWQRDPRGAYFWTELHELFAKGIAEMRVTGRKGDAIQTAYVSGKTDVVEEVLQLVDLIIQEKQEAKP
jgi:hypothetical protein